MFKEKQEKRNYIWNLEKMIYYVSYNIKLFY